MLEFKGNLQLTPTKSGRVANAASYPVDRTFPVVLSVWYQAYKTQTTQLCKKKSNFYKDQMDSCRLPPE